MTKEDRKTKKPKKKLVNKGKGKKKVNVCCSCFLSYSASVYFIHIDIFISLSCPLILQGPRRKKLIRGRRKGRRRINTKIQEAYEEAA
jgi:hypothetical protein